MQTGYKVKHSDWEALLTLNFDRGMAAKKERGRQGAF
jgi:hypothetical protein